MKRDARHWSRALRAAVRGAALFTWAAAAALAHPISMNNVDQHYTITVRPDAIEIDLWLRYAEFPSMTQRRRMDADRNNEIEEPELAAYRASIDEELLPYFELTVGGQRVPLRAMRPPAIDLFGLPEVVPYDHTQHSAFVADVAAPPGRAVTVTFETRLFPEYPGIFTHRLLARGVTVVHSSLDDAPPEEIDFETGMLLAPEIREVEFAYHVAEGPRPAEAEEEPPPPPPRLRGSRDAFAAGLRAFQDRVTAYFRGEFRLWAFLALLAATFVYGGVHALAPGHAKTITAAYLIGAHATPWHAVLLGLVVTVSHTWSIFALALVTHAFYGGEVQPETHGIVMAVSGGVIVVLGLGQFVSRLRGRGFLDHHHHGDHGHGPHDHHHDHADDHHHHDHDHSHDHDGDHDHHDHDHGHDRDSGEARITIGSLVALGFSGGIVPCPGALWIYFLALSVHRTLEGIVLITALGAGLATVLTAIGLLTVRVRRGLMRQAGDAERRGWRRTARAVALWLGRWLALIAPCIIAGLGLVLVFWGLLSAGVLGGS